MNAWTLFFAPVRHALLLPVRALRAKTLVRRGSFVALTIDGPVTMLEEPTPWWRRRVSRTTSLESVRELAGIVGRDPKVRGLIVEIRAMKTGAALATSLRSILAATKDAQKTVVVYLPMGGGSRELLVASAASRVVVGPQSTIPSCVFAHTRLAAPGAGPPTMLDWALFIMAIPCRPLGMPLQPAPFSSFQRNFSPFSLPPDQGLLPSRHRAGPWQNGDGPARSLTLGAPKRNHR